MPKAGLVAGALVEIAGLPGPASPAAGAEAESIDLNGQSAQLIKYDKDAGRWLLTTFEGAEASVMEDHLTAIGAEKLAGFDFVYGPASDLSIMGPDLTQTLYGKGYAVMRLFVAPSDDADILKAATTLEAGDHFGRLPDEFEQGYLGVEGSGKTCLVNPYDDEAPEDVKSSPLATVHDNFGALSALVGSSSEEVLGFGVHSRSDLLLQLPLVDGDDDKYPPADIDDGDAEKFFHIMCRRKVTMMQFVGAKGSLTLLPADEEDGANGIKIDAAPSTVVLIVASRFKYTYQEPAAGKSLAISSMVLTEPALYALEGEVMGDTELLNLLGTGPQPPPAKQCGITGQYCRYGTGSEGRDQFWCAVGKGGTDGITCVPFCRYDYEPYYEKDGLYGLAYTKHGCFGVEGVDLFDCKYFEIAPAEARIMDPCQRQVMEVSYMALLEGGYDKRSLQRKSENIGHFVGIDKDDWLCMSAGGCLDLSGGHGAASAANAITSNRFSYSLNIKGASMTIDTACSSSLVCTHVAKLHLRNMSGEIMPAAVVNGLNLMLFHGPFVGCCGAGMLSHEGRSFTYNATADGYARGELCGAACFTLLNWSKDQGIIACLAGSYANQDGRSASLSAPNGPAQEKCINSCLKECALTPTEIDCFECHGTGTSLGDPIEVGSFRRVMSTTERYRSLPLTSSKSNIAHGEGGAGFAGFMECIMQVSHCEASTNVHLRVLNPHLDTVGFPCQFLTDTIYLENDSSFCGVSSFGFGGTNAHGEAWGKNIYTSRGVLKQNPKMAFQRKLARAPVAEITMNGDNVDDWETTGIDPRGNPGDKWTIEIDDDGAATWEKVEEDMVEFGDEFFIQGTHNAWATDAMERHDSISGLWTGEISLDSTGVAEFQIIADGDAEKVYHPPEAKCARRSAPVQGPEACDKEKAWVLTGPPYASFKIEFFIGENSRSVIWMKSKETSGE
jgi:polyketide synthase-associated protein